MLTFITNIYVQISLIATYLIILPYWDSWRSTFWPQTYPKQETFLHVFSNSFWFSHTLMSYLILFLLFDPCQKAWHKNAPSSGLGCAQPHQKHGPTFWSNCIIFLILLGYLWLKFGLLVGLYWGLVLKSAWLLFKYKRQPRTYFHILLFLCFIIFLKHFWPKIRVFFAYDEELSFKALLTSSFSTNQNEGTFYSQSGRD